ALAIQLQVAVCASLLVLGSRESAGGGEGGDPAGRRGRGGVVDRRTGCQKRQRRCRPQMNAEERGSEEAPDAPLGRFASCFQAVPVDRKHGGVIPSVQGRGAPRCSRDRTLLAIRSAGLQKLIRLKEPMPGKGKRAGHVYRVAAEIMCQKGYEA